MSSLGGVTDVCVRVCVSLSSRTSTGTLSVSYTIPVYMPAPHPVHSPALSASLNFPVEQFAQGTVPPGLNCPAAQITHTACPGCALNLPIEQAEHMPAPAALEKDPVGHTVQLPAEVELLYCPGAQGVHGCSKCKRNNAHQGSEHTTTIKPVHWQRT